MIRLKICPARLEDAADLAALHVRSWQSAYRDILPAAYLASLTIERSHARWVGLLGEANASQEVYVARDQRRQLAGFVVYGRSRDEDATSVIGEVMGIYLDERAAGQGVGRALMEHALAGLKASGFTETTLWVLRDNARARRFYERIGFMPDGITKSEERPGAVLHEVRYRRLLT